MNRLFKDSEFPKISFDTSRVVVNSKKWEQILSSGNADDANSGDDISGSGSTVLDPRIKTKQPSLYRVFIINDDFTPMDFVVHVLQKFFQKDYTEATRIMLQVHHQGRGVAGTYTFEIAETRVFQVNQYARQNHHPLKCTMEKA